MLHNILKQIIFIPFRYTVPFNTLDIDDVQNTTINFGKVFNQLDKGLPPNKIVPKCKETIDIIKEKVNYSKNTPSSHLN